MTLPRLSGARVTAHREGDNLVDAVANWATDPRCGLVPDGAPPRKRA